MAKEEFEFAHLRAKIAAKFLPPVTVHDYEPAALHEPANLLPVVSAWKGHEMVLQDLLERFHIPRHRALEFGVEFGFSAAAFASYFDSFTGVDTFQGDRHTVNSQDIYAETVANLAPYPNIRLVRSDYRDFIRGNDERYDLIHVDIIHTYAATYECGLWSAQHSACTLFHDTESFPAVKLAVVDIARKTGKTMYNFKEFYGLGILV